VVALVAAMTQPRADSAACDARVEALAADSRIVRALTAASDRCERAAGNSAVRAAWRRTIAPNVPATLVERVRAVGGVTAVAAATTLILRLAGTGTEPLTWMLPAAIGAIALACIAAAAPIARAMTHHHW
jgi:hypothetical protein